MPKQITERHVIIDNVMVSNIETLKNGMIVNDYLKICPIKLAKKENPKLDVETIQVITMGDRKLDWNLIVCLSDGMIKFDDLFHLPISKL
jgi:hypothetical protein